MIELQKVRMSPEAAFSVNDWTAFVIFIVVIGGIGTIEGPILGTLIYFVLREYLAELGSLYLMILRRAGDHHHAARAAIRYGTRPQRSLR